MGRRPPYWPPVGAGITGVPESCVTMETGAVPVAFCDAGGATCVDADVASLCPLTAVVCALAWMTLESAAGATGAEALVLQARPIGEPVAQYGPFVMNTREELAQAFEDYQKGRLGVIPAERLPHTD